MELQIGKPVLVYGNYTGAVLKMKNDTALVSFYAEGVNMCQEVPLDEVSVGGVIIKPKTTNEVVEIEDAGCEGGACKIWPQKFKTPTIRREKHKWISKKY